MSQLALENYARMQAIFLDEQAELLKDQAVRTRDLFSGSGSGSGASSSTLSAAKHSDEKKRKVKKPVDPNAPKKPLSGYLIFMQDKTGPFKAAHPEIGQKDVMTTLGQQWSSLSEAAKAVYQKRAQDSKEEYDREFAAYQARGGEASSSSSSSSSSDPASKKKKTDAAPAPSPVVAAAVPVSAVEKKKKGKKGE